MSIDALLNRLDDITTPAYVLDETVLRHNLETAKRIREEADVKIVLATKAFAMFQAFPMMKPYLDGTTASGYYEALLGYEEFGKEVHVYSPAFTDAEIKELMPIATHISFNSPSQFKRFQPLLKQFNPKISTGLRINPQMTVSEKPGYDKYNPCAPCSRMGSIRANIDDAIVAKLEGLHFHILCEHMAENSVALIDHVAVNYGDWLHKMKWVNFGGGHFINHPDYNVDMLIDRLKAFRAEFPHLEVILEPGGGLVLDAGYLVSTVLDITENEKKIAILDTSANAHMPDVIIVPIRPMVHGAGEAGEKGHDYVLGGRTCMTADVIGTYSFDAPLKPNDKIILLDQMQYSFVQNTNFNGMPLPDIGVLHENGRYEVWQSFSYGDFKRRLGRTR